MEKGWVEFQVGLGVQDTGEVKVLYQCSSLCCIVLKAVRFVQIHSV